ncbi:MAG: hypothetical protein ACW981_18560 [Candidatus Hodarchaeales archaeon]
MSGDSWGHKLPQHEARAIQKFRLNKKKKKIFWVVCPVCIKDNEYNNKKCSNCGLKLKIIGSA